MTADIRAAAQREAKRLRVTSNGREYGMAKLYKDAFVDGAVWAAERVTPRREQIAEVLDGDRYYDPDQISNLDRADAILALMQELAEGESNAQTD